MTNNNTMHVSEEQTQFVLSLELLYLLQWLVDHDAPKIKKIIGKALASGLKQHLRHPQLANRAISMEEVQHSVVEFLSLLEELLLESMTEASTQRALEKKLIDTADLIDATICDDSVIQTSIERATIRSDNNPKANPRELLFQEVLKRWKPAKKIDHN